MLLEPYIEFIKEQNESMKCNGNGYDLFFIVHWRVYLKKKVMEIIYIYIYIEREREIHMV